MRRRIFGRNDFVMIVAADIGRMTKYQMPNTKGMSMAFLLGQNGTNVDGEKKYGFAVQIKKPRYHVGFVHA